MRTTPVSIDLHLHRTPTADLTTDRHDYDEEPGVENSVSVYHDIVASGIEMIAFLKEGTVYGGSPESTV